MKIPFKKKSIAEYIMYSAIILGGILIDQLTKFLVNKFMMPGQSIPLIKGFLHLTYTTNDGAAFGMMDGARWLFIAISVIAILAFAAYLYLGHAETPLYAVAISMVVSGGIGNMIDRIALRYVVDFIDFRLINFAVFNGADSFVCVGAGLMVLALIREIIAESRAEKEKKEKAATELSHKEDGEGEL